MRKKVDKAHQITYNSLYIVTILTRRLLNMEILGYTLISLAAAGLMSNFFFVWFMDENDKINEAYLEEEKAKLVKYGP